MKIKRAVSGLIQPVDRDYRDHGTQRAFHLELYEEEISYCVCISNQPLVFLEYTDEED